MYLTFEERERRAYIAGDTTTAELMQHAAFGEECDDMLDSRTPQELLDQLEETEAKVTRLADENTELTAQVEDHELTIARLREQLAETEAELDQLREQVK